MKRVTAIRHVAFEDLVSFAGVLTDNGFEIRHSTHRPLKHDKAAAKGAAPTLLHLLSYFSRDRNYDLSAKWGYARTR